MCSVRIDGLRRVVQSQAPSALATSSTSDCRCALLASKERWPSVQAVAAAVA